MKEAILNIVKEEFSALVNRIQGDFMDNYCAKQNNFLLNELDPLMTAHMVFVSSFESKSGNSLQRIARNIVKLRYGNDKVPQIINPNNISHNIVIDDEHEQIVVTNVDIDNAQTKAYVNSFMNERLATGRGKKRIESRVTHESIKELLNHAVISDNVVHQKPVDLAFFDDTDTFNIMEIKAGGDLDNSNAPANAQKLLLIYMALNMQNVKPYFATYYNKDGENHTWKGSIKKYINYPGMFLIGSTFWNKILPEGIDYNEFTKIYNEAINQINLNEKLNDMIRSCQ